MPDLTSSITDSYKITKPQIAALKKLGINSVQDLLFYFPYRYLDFSQTKKIKDLKPEENISIRASIKSIKSRFSFRGRMSLCEAIISDDSASIKVVWFNQPYLAKSLHPGEEIFLAGSPEYYKNSLQLTNPIYEKASEFPIHTSRLVPVYHLATGIYPKTIRKFIADALPLAEKAEDALPKDILKKLALPGIAQTINFAHFPANPQQAEMAKKRLAFEELFLNQLLAQRYKLQLAQKQSFHCPFDQKLTKKFLAQLPFTLTAEQKKAAWEILQDLEKNLPMNRLLEGDVGSGKTLVALLAALQAINAGWQVALLSPTEILAKQHFETAKSYFLQQKICLLTNNYSLINSTPENKKKLLELMKQGMPGLFIGTHALLENKIKFQNLALVIIDEQHRFGVQQRAKLVHKEGKIPHLLSLSATPIPRTLQLAIYGDLDVSAITTKPQGRKPIITKVVNGSNRPKAYEFIKKQLLAGRQAFVITPLIEESDKLGVKAAKSEFIALQKIFPEFKIALLHGKLKASEKEQAMSEFLSQTKQILVTTSVVEVGVDVPNASVMVIEGAERFGLAQLHQFRGRVGRAEHQSYCFLFTQKDNPETLKRLESFSKTQDGFALAELDLKQRGFGQLLGEEQSGWNFKYFDPEYIKLIPLAKKEAEGLLKLDPDLTQHPQLKNKIDPLTIHLE